MLSCEGSTGWLTRSDRQHLFRALRIRFPSFMMPTTILHEIDGITHLNTRPGIFAFASGLAIDLTLRAFQIGLHPISYLHHLLHIWLFLTGQQFTHRTHAHTPCRLSPSPERSREQPIRLLPANNLVQMKRYRYFRPVPVLFSFTSCWHSLINPQKCFHQRYEIHALPLIQEDYGSAGSSG